MNLHSTLLQDQVTRLHIAQIFACLLITVCCAAGVQAQEVSVFSVHSSSSQPVLSESAGFGLSAAIEASRWLRVEGSFTTVSRDSRRAARVCGSYIPPGNCGEEQLSEEYGLRSYRLAYTPQIYSGGVVDVVLKGGLSMSQIVSDSRTESLRKTNLQHTRTGQDGRFVGAQVSVRPIRRLPFAVQVGGVSHWVSFDGCQEHDFQYAPFCGIDRFDQLQVGAAFLLRR